MLLPILKYPNKLLRAACEPVTSFDDKLRELVSNMLETMHEADGAGLAAIQVGVPLRLFVLDPLVVGGTQHVFINPEILEASPEKLVESEGCLSFPGIFVPVQRAKSIRVSFQTLSGELVSGMGAEGFHAKAIQHEYDHLLNKLLIDYVGSIKRDIIKRKLRRSTE